METSTISKEEYTAMLELHMQGLGAGEIRDRYRWVGKDTFEELCGHFASRVMHRVYTEIAEDEEKHAEIYCFVWYEVLKGSGDRRMLEIAREKRMAPTHLAELFLTAHLKQRKGMGKEEAKAAAKDFLRNTAEMESIPGANAIFLENLRSCVFMDTSTYAFKLGTTRKDKGNKGEVLLFQELEYQKIPYFTEAMLRAVGEHKTPDSLLQSPILVDGHVVNWIESKYMFGTQVAISIIKRDQLVPYKNRFGNGMIIFWLGYISDIPMPEGVIARKEMPEVFERI
ncbi:MAG: uncharacterized protein A8A55_0234 [Amphiamblys sp. WSBS2006]|nr:MAG: uncharacterized protein A8A55_0234 [Amphiamblys sp. WSBS2006]